MLSLCIALNRIGEALTVVISAERPKKTAFLVIAANILVLVLLTPMFLTMTVVWITDPITNSSMAVVTPTDFYERNREAVGGYLHTFLTVTLSVVLMLTIFICSAITFCSIKRSSSLRETMMAHRSSHRRPMTYKVTKMLLRICTTHLVCNIPATKCQCLSTKYRPYYLQHDLFLVVSSIDTLISTINAGCNFVVIYMLMHDTSSMTFKKIFFGKVRQHSTSVVSKQNY